jgi:hypothetical protein
VLTKSSIRKIWAAAAVGAVVSCGNIALAEEKPAAATPAKVEQSCLVAPAKLGDKEVQDFMAAPAKLLTENPAGGLPMSNRVRELAGSSSGAMDQLIGLTKSANDGQKSAIAAGLARAVSACGTVNPDYASVIQNAVAGLGDPSLIAAFAQATNDIKVAAVGAPGASSFAGGGATGADGVSKQSGDNAYKYPGDSGIDTTSGTYDIGSANSLAAEDTVTTTIISTVAATGG